MDNRELDALLTQRLADAPVADDGFTDGVRRRLQSHRRRRRATLLVAAIAAAIPVASIGTIDLSAVVTAPQIVAMMMLAAVCAVVWIATESREASLTRGVDAAERPAPN